MQINPWSLLCSPISTRRAQAAQKAAFTRVDLFVVLATAGVLAGLVLPLMANPRARSEQVMCANNLRQIGQGIQTWGADHGGKPPWMVKQNDGGLMPNSGQVLLNPWQVFAFMSDLPRGNGTRGDNVLGTPRILVCPSETKTIASEWSIFSDGAHRNLSVSYFIGLHAPPEEASSWMSGDRNLGPMDAIKAAYCKVGVNNADGWIPSYPVTWDKSIHGVQGNILQTSGAVLQLDNEGLSKAYNTNSMMVNFEGTSAVHLLLP